MADVDALSWPDGLLGFLACCFPYLLDLIMADVGARVVYSLGTEVRRAPELRSTAWRSASGRAA